MLDSIGKYVFLKVPENDRDRALTVRVFNCVSASIIAFLIVGGIGAIFVFVRKTGSVTIVIMLGLLLIIALWIAHRGKIRHAAITLICGLWAASTFNIWLSGTANTVFVGMYIAVIAVAGVLIGSRFAVIIASMSIASAFALSLLQSVGYTWPSYYPMPPWSALLVLLFAIVLIVPAITGMVEAFTEASSQATQEIERRRRTEEILGESEERYRFLFERSGNAVAVYKPVNDGEDFIFVDFNKAGEQMEQISREELIGKSVLQLFPGVKELGLFDVLQRVWRTGEPEHHPVGHYEDDRIRGWRDNFVYRLPSGEIVAVYSDETERKLAEEALRSSEKAYRTLAQNIPGIVYRVHFGGQATMEFFNNEVESITGFSEKELRIGEVCSIDPLILSEDRPKVVELVKQAFSKNTPFEIEYRIRDKNGAIRHLLEYGRPVSASAGSPSFIDGVIFDISERKKAQEQIEGQASLMESLLEAIPAPVFYKDTDHVYIGCNEAFAEFIGLPKANIIGKSVFDVAPKELAEVYRTQDEALFNNPVTQIYEASVKSSDGTTHDVMFHKATFADSSGAVAGLIGVILDITDRKKAEEELRESEEKYRTVVEESFDGVFVQKGALIAFGNSRLYEMLGYNKRELEGLDHWLIYHPDYQDITRARARARLAGESVPPRYEVNLLRKDGTSFPGEINAKVILFDNELQIQVWVRDLTEQKHLEKRLVEAQKMEAVGTLAGGIAHDFNNLLHIISGHAELLEMQLAEKEMRFAEMDAIRQAANRSADLVKQLLTFSRKVDTKFKSINLNEDVRNTERLLYRTIPKMIEIELRLDEDLQPVRADSTQVEQMLINLAVNAKDAMPEGGKLTIETKEVLLDEGYWRDHPELVPGRYVLLRVSDTGHGMEEDVLQHIFEPFFTTKGLADGTGLGLATVFGIVKMHGGHISCESEVGKGTTLSIYLPVAEAAKSEVEQGQEVSSAAGGTENILMVDDEPLIRDLAKRILERAGYSVIAACSGREAIEIYAQHKSDIALVILDLIMPEMGGKQCLEELVTINPQVKALIASGFAVTGDTKSFLDSEAKGTVSKPFNMRELLSAVRRVLDGI